MPFVPEIAAVRFGTGLSPVIAAPASVDDMIARLTGPDRAGADFPIPLFADARPTPGHFRDLSRLRRDDDPAIAAAAQEEHDRLTARANALRLATFGATLARWAHTADGLRERLVAFWANHFTVRSKSGFTAHLVTPFVEEAIRPNITGRFADLLTAVITHPMMLAYLDQTDSMGPNSEAAQRRDRGLNENLARELLELHTVGVDGPYDQDDVRQLAELLTGLGWDMDAGHTVYRPTYAEPGAETVLDTTYPARADIATIRAALEGLAAHPATARFIATKLVRHFITDTPPEALVATLETTFRDTDGDLLAVTSALLAHPLAWANTAAKVRTPFEFLAASLRALAVPPAVLIETDVRQSRRRFQIPLSVMGQPWEQAPGPDGWADEAAAWITPQFMAGRIDWAMRVPVTLLPDLPDPRDFVAAVLAPVPDPVAFAAAAAEDRPTGVGVVLASSAFQRR